MKSKTIAAFGLVVGALLINLYLGQSDVEPETTLTKTSDPVPAQADNNNNVTEAKTVPQNKSFGLPGVEVEESSADFDPEMKQRLLTISEAYEEQIKFPNFSKPIKEGELEGKYLADIPIANEQPARLTDPNSPTLSIKPSKFRYFEGDVISATASIAGLSEDMNSSVDASIRLDDQVIARAIVTPIEGNAHSFLLEFDSLANVDGSLKKELTLETEFQFGGEEYQRGSTIEYVPTIASVDDVAPARVEAEYLLVPVYVSTDKPGYHRLRGNLYDASTNKPLIHLRAEELLESSHHTFFLKAHIAALKDAGSEGPYELKDLSLQRLPAEPDYVTEFGNVSKEAYFVDGYSFSEYTDVPFIDEKAQRIAKELRRLGS